jgi:hypothetical protein
MVMETLQPIYGRHEHRAPAGANGLNERRFP